MLAQSRGEEPRQGPEVLRPLKVEASTIKFWLARVANYLERVEPSSEDPHAADLVGLFGPCSPVHQSPTPCFFNSFAAACMSTRDSLLDDEKSVTTTGDVGQSPSKDFGIFIANVIVLEHTTTPTLQLMSMQVGTSIEDVAVMEDASDDEETTSDVEPPSIVTPLATSTSRRRCKHYDKLSVHRSVHLTQHRALIDLGIIANDGKFNEGVIRNCTDILKELPPDRLKSLANLKSKDF
ncbi:hypothetical protein PVAP13_J683414 [Panicum virgatum]|nr:hypothetical protein PVAP13_J683414 [Panicum virgatum]